jgi:hypothetical protein
MTNVERPDLNRRHFLEGIGLGAALAGTYQQIEDGFKGTELQKQFTDFNGIVRSRTKLMHVYLNQFADLTVLGLKGTFETSETELESGFKKTEYGLYLPVPEGSVRNSATTPAIEVMKKQIKNGDELRDIVRIRGHFYPQDTPLGKTWSLFNFDPINFPPARDLSEKDLKKRANRSPDTNLNMPLEQRMDDAQMISMGGYLAVDPEFSDIADWDSAIYVSEVRAVLVNGVDKNIEFKGGFKGVFVDNCGEFEYYEDRAA